MRLVHCKNSETFNNFLAVFLCFHKSLIAIFVLKSPKRISKYSRL